MFGEKGLVQIYTGNGKGKTTAALGIALRASGHGAKIMMIQFMKGWVHYGELSGAKSIPSLTLIQTGRPDYVYKGQATEEDYAEAARGVDLAESAMRTGSCDMLILDELNVALDMGLVDTERIVKLLKNKPFGMELILTGRDAKDEILALADLVTEMREIRHPYQKGEIARKGIEY